MLSIQLDILYKFYENNFLEVALTFSKIFHFCFPFSAHHLVRRDCISAIEINYFMVDQVCMSGKFYNCWCVSRNHLKIFVTFQKVTAEDFCAFVIDISVIVPSLSSSLRLPWSFLSFGLLWILSFHHSYQCPWQKHYGHQESTQPEHGNDFPCVGFHIFPSTQNCSTNVKAKINLPLLK